MEFRHYTPTHGTFTPMNKSRFGSVAIWQNSNGGGRTEAAANEQLRECQTRKRGIVSEYYPPPPM